MKDPVLLACCDPLRPLEEDAYGFLKVDSASLVSVEDSHEAAEDGTELCAVCILALRWDFLGSFHFAEFLPYY